jgi:hypothetical protein
MAWRKHLFTLTGVVVAVSENCGFAEKRLEFFALDDPSRSRPLELLSRRPPELLLPCPIPPHQRRAPPTAVDAGAAILAVPRDRFDCLAHVKSEQPLSIELGLVNPILNLSGNRPGERRQLTRLQATSPRRRPAVNTSR